MKAAPGRDAELASVTTRVLTTIQTSRGGRFAGDTFKGVRAVIRGFRGERISLRAAALTYLSIFSLVPLLTVGVVLVHSLQRKQFQQRLLTFIHDVFAPGIRDESTAILERFIDRASSVTAGSVGFLMLLISAGMLLKNLDASLNDIWGVRRKRPLILRVLYYMGILLLGPVLVTFSLVGTADLRNLLLGAHFAYSRQLFVGGALAVAVTLFTLLYYVAPNAPVKFRSALAGGLVAGTGWELARHAYAEFGAQIFRVNPVYGSLGEAPLFLAWIYLSWLLVLFGARLAYAVEYASFQGVYRALGNHPRARELVAAQMAQILTLAHVRQAPAPTPKELSRRLEVPEETVLEITEQMEMAQLISIGRRGGLFPARHPDQLTVAELSAAVGGVIDLLTHSADQEKTKEFQHLEALFTWVDRSIVERLSRVTWSSLIAEELKVPQPELTREREARKVAARRNP